MSVLIFFCFLLSFFLSFLIFSYSFPLIHCSNLYEPHIKCANLIFHQINVNTYNSCFLFSYYLFFLIYCLFYLPFFGFIHRLISGRVMKWSYTPSSCTEPLRRVQSLKFRSEEQSDLNDILLRVSAFGLFVYAVFSVIAGGMGAFTHEPNLLVMITGCLSVLQVKFFE